VYSAAIKNLNAERTEDLRDLSVEALEERRSWRTPCWLRRPRSRAKMRPHY